MELLKAAGEGVGTVIEWIQMVNDGLFNIFDLPDWTPVVVAIGIFSSILAGVIKKCR